MKLHKPLINSFSNYKLLIALLFVFVPVLIQAQSSDLELQVELSPALENAQILGFNNLGIDQTGKGPVIVSFYIENRSAGVLENLFIDIIISSSISGTIAEIAQNNNNPISLDFGQSVYATNNDLANESIPGIEEDLRFEAEITDQGRDLINGLEGSTTLPVDVYVLTLGIYQNNNRLNGGELLATQTIELGGGSEGDIRDIFLKAPGDEIGNETEITNPLPEFSWDGEVNLDYRLIVVRDNGLDSPEALIQAAQSTNPTSGGNLPPGSLLENENIDVVLNGINFQYPANGAQPLIPGSKYFWQLIGQVQTADGIQEVPSTVWNFTLVSPSSEAGIQISSEAQEAIINVLGQELFQELYQAGFKIESINIDGLELVGPELILKLEEFLEKIQNEEIIIDREN